MTHDPSAVLLTRADVAHRLGKSPAWVAKCQHATDPEGEHIPMPGWFNIGPTRRPEYVITEADLIEWIDRVRELRAA